MTTDDTKLGINKLLVRQLLDPSDNDISLFGNRVVSNKDADIVVISAPLAEVNTVAGNGAVYAYELVNDVYTLTQTLTVDTAGWYTRYGHDITMDDNGTTLVVSSPNDDSDHVGAQGRVYIYKKSISGWVIAKELTNYGDTNFGKSIDISGNGLVLTISSTTPDGGVVYVYMLQDDDWVLAQNITSTIDVTKDGFGWLVRLDYSGKTIVITTGAIVNGVNIGSACVYYLIGCTWRVIANLVPPDGVSGDNFGYSVEISYEGTDIAIGAPSSPNINSKHDGGIYIFSKIDNVWTAITRLRDNTNVISGSYGGELALSRSGTAIITRVVVLGKNKENIPNINVYVRGVSIADTTHVWRKVGTLTGDALMTHVCIGSSVTILGEFNVAVSATVGGSNWPASSTNSGKSVVYIMDPRML